MAEGSSSGSRKRSFNEDDESNKPPAEKRVRFPKGKKLKQGDYVTGPKGEEIGEEIIPNWKDPRLVSKERAMRRSNITPELLKDEVTDNLPDIRRAEVLYKDETLDEEGASLEPFNLEKEREEGYFDENGNYVEYVNRNEIKDAWLDSVDVEPKYAGKSIIDDGKTADLLTADLAVINRRIADALEPGETVLRALRRLKGPSADKKQKMPEETKQIFDQLTEDASKLMDNGDYNVYEEKQESFNREAERHEKVVNARKQEFDIFADDDENATENPNSNGSGSIPVQPSESGDQQNDYVFDESSGYYYSSSLGYYYDPTTGFYCSAASGKWYSYDQESGAYNEVQQDTDMTSSS